MRAEAEHQGADVDISVLEQQAIRDIMGSRTDHLTGVGRLVPQGARMAAEVAEVYGSEAGTSQPGYVSQEVLTSTLAAFAETIQSQVPGLNLSSFMSQFPQSSQQAPSSHSQQTPTAGVHTPTPDVRTPTGGQQRTPDASQQTTPGGPSQSTPTPQPAELQRQQKSVSRRGGGKRVAGRQSKRRD